MKITKEIPVVIMKKSSIEAMNTDSNKKHSESVNHHRA